MMTSRGREFRAYQAVALAVCLLALAGTADAAATGRIRGRVLDASTREPLIGANVVVEGTELGAATDAAGEYLVANVPAGRHDLVCSYIGYETQRKTGVVVIPDQTVTEDFGLGTGDRIQMGEVVVAGARDAIVRTVASTSRPMTDEEIAKLPVATLADIVKLQTGVVTSPVYGQHLRGGRPDEVAYYVDGVATSDPLFGYQAARVNPEATAEVVIISGGFDAEYGEAMSGIIQVITKEGKGRFKGRLKYTTDELLPGGLNFGDNRYEASLGGPVPGFARLRYFMSGELYFTDDYSPLKHKLSHQQRQDYKGTMKLTYSLPVNEGMRLTADGFAAREQFEMFPWDRENENHLGFRYNLDRFLSRRDRAKKADVSVNHMLSKTTFYTMRFNYFGDERTTAVRDLEREAEERNFGTRFWDDYVFKAEDTVKKDDSVLFRPMPGYVQQSQVNTNNPWGVYNLYYGAGDYRFFQMHWADVLTLKGDVTHNIGKVHEFKTGLELRKNYLHRRYNSLPWDPNPFVDSYDVEPINAAAFVQDRMDFEDLVVRAGLRLDYLAPLTRKRARPDVIEDTSTVAAETKFKLSPRLGVSFPITNKTKFRFSYGHFFQTPAYRYLFDNIGSAAYSRGNMIIGNPDLLAQQTIAYELGLEQEVSRYVVADLTAYYKDIFDLMGTRFQPAIPLGYFPLVNEEYGSVRGFEVGVQKALSDYWNARVSYGLSLARGTASYTYEWYYERYRYGTDPVTGMQMEPPRRDYALEFDERHNAKLSLGVDLPGDLKFIPLRDLSGTVLVSYGSGLPYTPREVGARGLNAGRQTAERNSARMPPRFAADLNAAKFFRVGGLKLGLTAVVTNLLNNQTVHWVYGATGLPDDDGYAATLSPANWGVTSDVTLLNPSLYNPVRDRNHDGYITDEEEYSAYKVGYLDFVNNPINYGAPRQIRVGVSLEF
ncbi:TonB-dependent receptor [candidate division WOR-3 bacterium]|nr:TonB-dependent receptor [candidate division WOR-3 bacterium]